MTKAEIWKQIGDAFDTPFEDRTPHQIRLSRNGICWSLVALHLYDDLSWAMYLSMKHKVSKDLDVIAPEEAYFCRTRGAFNVNDIDKDEMLEADAFRAKYCYERLKQC